MIGGAQMIGGANQVIFQKCIYYFISLYFLSHTILLLS